MLIYANGGALQKNLCQWWCSTEECRESMPMVVLYRRMQRKY
uniref:Uncharacterized protein n=1 Tax=Arundo donax TaxID=35708 RepID=A0A0A9FYU4_ARUDO